MPRLPKKHFRSVALVLAGSALLLSWTTFTSRDNLVTQTIYTTHVVPDTVSTRQTRSSTTASRASRSREREAERRRTSERPPVSREPLPVPEPEPEFSLFPQRSTEDSTWRGTYYPRPPGERVEVASAGPVTENRLADVPGQDAFRTLPARVSGPLMHRRLAFARAQDVDTRIHWETIAADTAGCEPDETVVALAGADLERRVGELTGREALDRDRQVGELLHDGLLRGSGFDLYEDQATVAYVGELLRAIDELRSDRSVSLQLHLVDHPSSNVMALLGGHLFVTRGLLENRDLLLDEASLVFLLAREVGHLDLNHVDVAHSVIAAQAIPLDDAFLEVDHARFMTGILQAYRPEEVLAADTYAFRTLRALGYSNLRAERLMSTQTVQEVGEEGYAGWKSPWVHAIARTPSLMERACHLRRLLREEPPDIDRAYRGTQNYREQISAFRLLH